METKLFKMRLVTNLHMGSGEANFNFIDNQIQRDPITEYPNMHSSGIKGALREFFDGIESKDYVREIFGSENAEKEDNKQGSVSFIEGKLLSIPVRSNKKSYFMGTTIEIIREYVEFSNLFGKNTENLKEIKEELEKIHKKLTEAGKKVCVLGNEEKGLLIESFENNEIDFSTAIKNKFSALIPEETRKRKLIYNNIIKEIQNMEISFKKCNHYSESVDFIIENRNDENYTYVTFSIKIIEYKSYMAMFVFGSNY